MARSSLRVLAILALVASAAGCVGEMEPPPLGPDGPHDGSAESGGRDGATGRDGEDGGARPFEPLPVAAYVAKVKGLLTGLAASGEEVAQVESDPASLAELIRTWQETPAYETRMVEFFTMAFQQGDVTAQLIGNVTPFEQSFLDGRVIQMMRESFGRTAMALVREGRPFTEVLTTRRFMLTPALMVAMAWLEERQSEDEGGFAFRDTLHDKLGDGARYVMQADTPRTIEESIDPQGGHFFEFYSPQVAAASGDCRKPVVVDHENRLTLYTHTMGETLMMWFMGQRLQQGFCVYAEGPGILAESDFRTWRMMTIRTPAAGEEQTWLYELPRFRQGTELVFPKPHVGFYTTPAFLYTWQTNDSNQARVTANQTLIAAVGRRFDGSLYAEPASTAALASEHAKPGTECYACHITMDPMRQFFRTTFTYNYGLQTKAQELASPGVWAFDGESAIGQGIAELGERLARSDRFAIGWVHKLCVWANGAVCDPSDDNLAEPTDPEFLRIVEAFRAGGYDYDALVRDLFSSPLVTHAEPTDTAPLGPERLSVAKRGQLCRAWDLRLGLDDACGLSALPSTSTGDVVKTVASVLPSDSYSRGQTAPTLSNDPGLFFFSGIENVCTTLATRVVGDAAPSRFRVDTLDVSLGELVSVVMGMTGGEADAARTLLREHFDAARAEGASELVALRSTFVLACLAPSAVGVGL